MDIRCNNSTDRMRKRKTSVPFVVLESALYHAERREKRLMIWSIVSCAIALASCAFSIFLLVMK